MPSPPCRSHARARSRKRLLWNAFALLVLSGFAVAEVRAQAVEQASHVTLRGQIVDQQSGQPISGATVQLPNLRTGTLTDDEGRFSIARVPVGSHDAVVSRLGYVSRETSWSVSSGMDPIRESLVVDPVIMEGLTVTVDRLERRRNASAFSTRVIDEDRLRFSAAPNLMEFVRSHGGAMLTPCPGVLGGWCVRSRGRFARVSVVIDEAPSFPEMLAAIQPHEVHTVELVQGGRMVRVYTKHFMERLARNPRILGAFQPF